MSEWDFYNQALAGGQPKAREGDIHTGFYRTRRYIPVAIWYHEGKPVARKGASTITDPHDVADLFLQVAGYPIAYDLYSDVINGRGWPHERLIPAGDPTASTNVLAPALAAVIEAPPVEEPAQQGPLPTIGHNKPPSEYEMLRSEVETWLFKAGKMKVMPLNQDEVDAYADVASRLQGFENKLDALYTVEKVEPEKALAAVRQRFLPYINDISARKKTLKKLIGEYATAETARRRQASDAIAAKRAAETGEAVEPPPIIPVTAGTVRSMGMREFRSAKIIDYAKALAYFAETPEVRAVVQSLANALAASDSRLAAPGCELITENRAA